MIGFMQANPWFCWDERVDCKNTCAVLLQFGSVGMAPEQTDSDSNKKGWCEFALHVLGVSKSSWSQGFGGKQVAGRGQSWPPDRHVGGRGLDHSSQRTCQSQSLIYHALISSGPRGIQPAISLRPLYPQPELDKGHFTWQSAMDEQGREKKGVPFSGWWEKILFPLEVVVTWFLFKTERMK